MTVIMIRAAGSRHAQQARARFNFAALLLFEVQQHDDEEKEHHDRAGIDEDLHRRQEKGVQQHEQAGHRYDSQY
jgi:hypothetical protein